MTSPTPYNLEQKMQKTGIVYCLKRDGKILKIGVSEMNARARYNGYKGDIYDLETFRWTRSKDIYRDELVFKIMMKHKKYERECDVGKSEEYLVNDDDEEWLKLFIEFDINELSDELHQEFDDKLRTNRNNYRYRYKDVQFEGYVPRD